MKRDRESETQETETQDATALTRREFVGVAAAGLAAGSAGEGDAQTSDAIPTAHTSMIINGQKQQFDADARTTLLDLLREKLQLTGTKKGCDHGQCGACTVLVNDRRVNSCLTLAATCDGDRITTIEGLASGEELHPMQAAFLEHDGFQCGYCTPGQICSAVGMLSEARAGAASAATHDVAKLGPAELTDEEIRERMSGNLCRCGAYPNIVTAVMAVAKAERARNT